MEIFVFSNISWETYTIEVESSATIAELKDVIEYLDATPVDSFVFINEDLRFLDGRKSLADYDDIENGSTIILRLIQRGGGSNESEIPPPSPLICRKVILLSKKILAIWTYEHDKLLLDLMVEHANNGGKGVTTGFKEEAWCDMATRINEEPGMNVAVSLLKKRLAFYEREYRIINDIRQQPALCWDHQHNKLIDVDDAWYQYEKEKPEAMLYRNRRVPHFDKLEILFSSASSSHKNLNMNLFMRRILDRCGLGKKVCGAPLE